MSGPGAARMACVVTLVIAACGCSTSPVGASKDTASGGVTVIDVAASINAWGSLLAQLGGTHVKETSIITNPDTDPHAYEPTPADGRTIAVTKLFVENGIGYDPWAQQALHADPESSRIVLDVGELVGVPAGGNPHRWYSPSDVETVVDAITADLRKLDPADARYFDARRTALEDSGFSKYHRLINHIKAKYAGTPVGASESIFAPLSAALGLNLRTPASFLQAVSEGTDPSSSDLATIDNQIARKLIKVYVFNSQNSTPDVAAQVAAARKQGIPVTAITETLNPADARFQDWQSNQLQALDAAFARASGG
jgi:zinc/manganese transport system substrate-binding protein